MRGTRRYYRRRRRRSRFSLAAFTDDVKVVQRRLSGRDRFSQAQWFSLFLMILSLLALLLLLNWTALFVVRVQVLGSHYTTTGEIVEHADVGGYHLFVIDPAKVSSQVEHLPFVRKAHVSVIWPNMVRISVEEREPLFTWQSKRESYWIDSEGILLPVVGALSSDRPLPVVVDPRGALLQPGQGATKLRPLYAERLLALFALGPDLRVVYYRLPEGFSFRLGERTTVYFGEADDTARRWTFMQSALASFRKEHGGAWPSRLDVARLDRAYVLP